MNPNLFGFWEQPSPGKVLYGGRMSGKSWDTAANLVRVMFKTQVRVLCTRYFQNKLSESVYSLIKSQVERFGYTDWFEFTRDSIRCTRYNSEAFFYGLARNIDEIKSMENISLLWIEEAHSLTEEMWEILEPTIIRNNGAEVWLCFNPRLATDFAYRRFVTNPPAGYQVRKVNYPDNPFLPQSALDKIEALQEEDPDLHAHIYLGVPRTDDDDSVIKRSWLMAAIDAHKTLGIEPEGMRRIGFDVADAGEDACAMIDMHGPLALWADQWKASEDELLKSCTRVWRAARERSASIVYDAIGVGATAGAKFNELDNGRIDRTQHTKFFAGGAVFRPDSQYAQSGIKNRDFFANVKAQAWWLAADRLRNTYNAVRNGAQFDPSEMVFFDSAMPHLDKLIDELAAPKRDYDGAGRLKVESKKDLAKREIASPNLADAFIMAAIVAEIKQPMRISADILRQAAR